MVVKVSFGPLPSFEVVYDAAMQPVEAAIGKSCSISKT